jgi:hypothetical protein
MKKWVKFTVLALVSLSVLNCSNALMGDGGLSGDSTTPPKSENNARVIIPLPGSSGRAVGRQNAEDITNFYAVHFKKTGPVPEYYEGSAKADAGAIVIEIPTGTYDILLFAGYQNTAPNDTRPLLLGSSFVQDQTINPGSNTVSLVIRTVDVDITSDAEIPSNGPFSAGVTINTKNPLLVPGDLTMYFEGPTAEGGFSDDDTIYPASPTTEPHVYKYTKTWTWGGGDTLTKGTTDGEISIVAFCSAFDDAIGLEWYLAKDGFDGPPPLDTAFKKSIPIGDPIASPSVSMDMRWANDDLENGGGNENEN